MSIRRIIRACRRKMLRGTKPASAFCREMSNLFRYIFTAGIQVMILNKIPNNLFGEIIPAKKCSGESNCCPARCSEESSQTHRDSSKVIKMMNQAETLILGDSMRSLLAYNFFPIRNCIMKESNFILKYCISIIFKNILGDTSRAPGQTFRWGKKLKAENRRSRDTVHLTDGQKTYPYLITTTYVPACFEPAMNSSRKYQNFPPCTLHILNVLTVSIYVLSYVRMYFRFIEIIYELTRYFEYSHLTLH